MRYLILFIGNTIALFLTTRIVSGITVTDLNALLFATLALALVNTFIRPIIKLFSLPITLITFGLFALVINAFTFAIAAFFVNGFEIAGILPAFFGALVFSILATLIDFIMDKFIKKPLSG